MNNYTAETKSPIDFDIHNYTHLLRKSKESGMWQCPVCNGHKLSIARSPGKGYMCYDGCDTKLVYREIKTLAGEYIDWEKEKNKPVTELLKLSRQSANTSDAPKTKEWEKIEDHPAYEEWVIKSGVKREYFHQLVNDGHLRMVYDPKELHDQVFANWKKEGVDVSNGVKVRESVANVGGWHFKGLDLETKQIVKNGTYKPPSPWKGKVKYINDMGVPSIPVFLPGIDWENVQFVILVEGLKKAAVLCSYGIAAIALPGVWQGVVKEEIEKDNGTSYIGRMLHDSIKRVLKEGVQVAIAFDNDPEEKLNTKTQVGAALSLLARKVQEVIKQAVTIVDWSEYSEKGCDDLIAAKGIDTFREKVAIAKPFSQWNGIHQNKLFGKVETDVNQKYLDVEIKRDAQVIGIKSPKGTGKTEMMKRVVRDYHEQLESISLFGDRTITLKNNITVVLSHRRQLQGQTAKRFNLPTLDEVHGKELNDKFRGVVVCVDSVLKAVEWLNKQEFDHYQIIIDECCQFLWHTIASTTEVSKMRLEKIDALRQLITDSERIIVADADLNTANWEFWKSLKPDVPTQLVINRYQHTNREIAVWKDAALMLRDILKQLGEGKKVAIATQGQQVGSAYSAQNIAAMIKRKFPTLKILIADSETVGDNTDAAFRAAERINELVHLYDIILYTPTFGTGISIDEGHGIDISYSFLMGVGSPMDALQLASRVRGDCDRAIYIAPRGLVWVGNGDGNSKSLLAGLNHRNAAEIRELIAYGASICIESNERCPFTSYWGKWGALLNQGNSEYFDWVIALLEIEGYEVVIAQADKSELKQAKKEVRENKEAQEQKYYESICQADDITEEERIERNRDSSALTKQQRKELKKAGFLQATRSVIELTPDNVRKYDTQHWVTNMRLHYALSPDKYRREEIIINDEITIEFQTKTKAVFAPDLAKKVIALKVRLLDELGINRLIEVGKNELIKSDNSLLYAISDEMMTRAWDVKNILRIKPGKYAIANANKLLNLLSLKLVELKELRKNKTRVYELTGLDDGRESLFAVWEKEAIAKRLESIEELVKFKPDGGVTNLVDHHKNNPFLTPLGRILTIEDEYEWINRASKYVEELECDLATGDIQKHLDKINGFRHSEPNLYEIFAKAAKSKPEVIKAYAIT